MCVRMRVCVCVCVWVCVCVCALHIIRDYSVHSYNSGVASECVCVCTFTLYIKRVGFVTFV